MESGTKPGSITAWHALAGTRHLTLE